MVTTPFQMMPYLMRVTHDSPRLKGIQNRTCVYWQCTGMLCIRIDEGFTNPVYNELDKKGKGLEEPSR